jgi:hypothetical protein
MNSAILSDGESEEDEYDRPSTSRTKYSTFSRVPCSFLTSTTTGRSKVGLPSCEREVNFGGHIQTMENLLCSHETNRVLKIRNNMRVKEMAEILYPGNNFRIRCPSCMGCKECEKIQHDNSHEENKIIEIICSLPLIDGWQEMISDTTAQAKYRIKKEVVKLNNYPVQRDELVENFKKLMELGFIKKYDDLPPEERRIVDEQQFRCTLPVSIAYKPDSVSTAVRLCMDASASSAGKASLNDELITSVKADRRGYEHTIQELDTCREEMMTLSSFIGKKISSRKRMTCQSISSDAQVVAEMAEE